METPLVFGGFSQETVERFGDRFRAMGLTPVAGLGGADPTAVQPEPLVPGSRGERGAGARGSVDGGDLHGDLCRSDAAAGVRASDYAVWAGGYADDQGGGGGYAGLAAECVQDYQYDGDGWGVYGGPGVGDYGAVRGEGADDSGGRWRWRRPRLGTSRRAAKTLHFEVLDNRQLTPSAMLVSVYQSLQANECGGGGDELPGDGRAGGEGAAAGADCRG